MFLFFDDASGLLAGLVSSIRTGASSVADSSVGLVNRVDAIAVVTVKAPVRI